MDFLKYGLTLLGGAAYLAWSSAQQQPVPQAPDSRNLSQKCNVCGEPTTRRCSKCKSVFYCTPEHAKADWGVHKPNCTRAKMIKAIVLPVDEDLPRVVDVVCKIVPARGGGGGYDAPQIRPHIGNMSGPGWITIDGNGYARPALHDHSLVFAFSDTFLIDGSPINKCVRHITGGTAPYKWAGLIMVMRQVGSTRTRSERYEDLPLEEFMDIGVEYLKVHNW